VKNFAKIIPEFSGENMSVQQWFNNFELNAEAYGLNDKMARTAALVLESTEVYEYNQLCHQQIHNQLSVRVKANNKSFHEYMLQMKRIAARGTLDTESVIRYIVPKFTIERVRSLARKPEHNSYMRKQHC